jgi:multiple sugar transport system permease protein
MQRLRPCGSAQIRRHRLARVGLYLAAIAAALICAGPFLWSLITAF